MEAIRHTHRSAGREPLGDCPACDREWLTTSPTFTDLPSWAVGTIALIRAHIGEYTRTPVSYDTSVPGRVELSCTVGQSRFVAAVTTDGAPELSSWLLRDPARETSNGSDMFAFYRHMRDRAVKNDPVRTLMRFTIPSTSDAADRVETARVGLDNVLGGLSDEHADVEIGNVELHCDTCCDAAGPPAVSLVEALEVALADGWSHRDDGTDMCPSCVRKAERM